ncbi:MAG: hypothetical protein IPM18_10840 [Phycisphaerales bacterium]|nr:hypothetical protein [Phycisphaerales bacterium]
MKRAFPWTGFVFIFLLAGCPLFGPEVPATNTTIELRNNGDFTVEAVLIYGSSTSATANELRASGTRVAVTIPAGDTAKIERACNALGSMLIDEALLIIPGTFPRSTTTGVVRRDTDFTCGQILRYSFTHPAVPTTLNATFSAVAP